MKTESPFSGAMVDAYKSYAEGKVWLQENVNYTDSANKFCNSLTNALKAQEKQQQLTGQKQTLEELGLKNLNASLPKINTTFPVPGAVNTGNQTPTGGKSPAVPIKVVTPAPVSVITPTITTITTTCSTSTSITNTTTVTAIGSRPRGRPPGSKNSTTKIDTSKNAITMQQKLMASILQPFAGSLQTLEMITAQMDPSVKATVMALLAEPKFMKTLAMFPDPTSRNTLLREYFSISNFPNIQQLIDGFNSVFNYLATALQPQTTMASLLQPQMKAPKAEKTPAAPKPSAMSIFPTANKPYPALTTSPSKSGINPAIAATITPVSSLKSGASTIISVGSGQLTITPSISITPNPNPTKPTSVLPQMPAPSFNLQKPVQPKVRRSTGEKPAKSSQKAQRLSFPDLPPIPIAMDHLPKSLSIIPSSSFVPPIQSAPSPINIDLHANKPVKQTKPKKKSIDGNIVSQSKKTTLSIPGIDPNIFSKSLTNPQLQAQLNPLMTQYNFLSHYEQFITGVTQASLQLSKPAKSKATTMTSAPTQKPSIKVKQLDQLQGRQNPPKVSEKPKPAQKAKQQAFPTLNMSNVKNPPISRSPTVLNAYGTTISSVSHPSIPTSSPAIPTSFSTMSTATTNLPANIQIR